MQNTVNVKSQFPEAEHSAKKFGVLTVFATLGMVVVSNNALLAMLLLGLFVVGSQFVFHGATALAMKLEGSRRLAFQIGVSLLVPAGLSIYLLRDVSDVSAVEVASHLLSPLYAVVLLILGYLSWKIGSQLNRTLPFRGYLIAAGFLFVICWMGKYGVNFSSGDEDYANDYDNEAVAPAGLYFAQYLLYVVVAYIGLSIRIRRRSEVGEMIRREKS